MCISFIQPIEKLLQMFAICRFYKVRMKLETRSSPLRNGFKGVV